MKKKWSYILKGRNNTIKKIIYNKKTLENSRNPLGGIALLFLIKYKMFKINPADSKILKKDLRQR